MAFLLDDLQFFFSPKSVVIIGASDNAYKPGFLCIESIKKSGFKGKFYLVNPKKDFINGIPAFSSVTEISKDIDLAIIVVPAKNVPRVIKECGEKNIKGAIIISSGFKELGDDFGSRLEQQISKLASIYGLKVIGPNALGILNPYHPINATFVPHLNMIKKGGLAIVSQSGGMGVHLSHLAILEDIGISKLVSLGNQLNIGFEDILNFLEKDHATKAVGLYIEGINNPRLFLKNAGRINLKKPIIIFKAAKNKKMNSSALSHTGAMAGDYKIYSAAFRQFGIIEAYSLIDVIDIAKGLMMQPPAQGNRLAILTAQAGGGIVMADSWLNAGLPLAKFSSHTIDEVSKIIMFSNLNNPLDISWSISDSHKLYLIVKKIIEDEEVDSIIIGAVSSFFDSTMAEGLVKVASIAKKLKKPIFVFREKVKMVGKKEKEVLESAGIPVYPQLERAVNAMIGSVKYGSLFNKNKNRFY